MPKMSPARVTDELQKGLQIVAVDWRTRIQAISPFLRNHPRIAIAVTDIDLRVSRKRDFSRAANTRL